jgi:hypothetical protein
MLLCSTQIFPRDLNLYSTCFHMPFNKNSGSCNNTFNLLFNFIFLKGREQDWQGHNLICKLSQANCPSFSNSYELEQLKKLQNQIKIESDKGIEDKRSPQRYSKQYRSNKRELERQINDSLSIDSRSLECIKVVFSKNYNTNRI